MLLPAGVHNGIHKAQRTAVQLASARPPRWPHCHGGAWHQVNSKPIFKVWNTNLSERQLWPKCTFLVIIAIIASFQFSNGVMFPIYDPDTNLVYLCGKVSEYNYPFEFVDNLILKCFFLPGRQCYQILWDHPRASVCPLHQHLPGNHISLKLVWPFLVQTPDPQRGVGCMPKRGCDVSTCEISRFYRL